MGIFKLSDDVVFNLPNDFEVLKPLMTKVTWYIASSQKNIIMMMKETPNINFP